MTWRTTRRGRIATAFGTSLLLVALVGGAQTVSSAGAVATIGTSSSSLGYQHPAQDKVAYLHDGSLLVGFFNGSQGVIDHVTNPTTAPVSTQVQTIAGDEVTLYTVPGATSTEIWVQAGHELTGGTLEQVQHGTYDGTNFTWNSQTPIPGTIAPGRQDPSITWTGKWLIATWWDDVLGSNSDNVFMNWTTDRTGQTGWLSTAIQMTATNQNITQPNIRHSAKLKATVLVYGTHYTDRYRVLLDGKTDPSLANWTAENWIDSGYDDSESGFGGPQVAIDETTGKIHVFRAVLNAGGPTWHGVTYWLGTPDAAPMATGFVTWNPRLIVDGGATSDPPDIAGAVDASGKVYVFWTTSTSSGSLDYATLVSPYTSASAVKTVATSGSSPRYPHVAAQYPLNRGYVPLVYQSGSGPYSIVLDTTIAAAGGDTTPPSVPGGVAANAGPASGQVSVAWNASTDNVGVTGYTVYRNGSPVGSVGGSTLSYIDSTAASLTTYTYTVDAFDAAGNHSAQSTAANVTTPDWTPPTVPTGLSGSAPSPTEVDLTWTASTDNVAVTGYTVYRNGTSLGTTAAGVTNFADTTASPSTTYSYTVDAFDAAGNHSAQTAPISVTTPAVPDTQPPTVPTGVQATTVACGGKACVPLPPGHIDVSWNASTDNVAVTGYTVYRDGTQIAVVPANTLWYEDTGRIEFTTYSYTVDAFDAAGNHSAQSTAGTITTPDWTPPTVPTGLAATVVSTSEIDLSWNPSTDNVGVAGYTVHRNEGSSSWVFTTTAVTFADTGLDHGLTYTYTVDAFDGQGNHSVQSAPVSGTTHDDIPPTTPGSPAATATSATSVAVSWFPSTDNVAVAGYDVYRDGTSVATVGPAVLSYSDTVTPGSTHSYTVDAFDAAGNHSPQTAPISVTTPSTPPQFVQAAVVTTGSRVTSVTLTLGPVAKGDLLVGWFGQYDASGQVTVSDSVNGAWTRASASTTWRGAAGNPGDIALYYFPNAAAATGGLTITVKSGAATYLQASVSEYAHVAAVNPLDQVVVAKGSGTSADSGLTSAVPSGELVYGAMVATNNAGTLTPGAGFVKRAQSSSGTQGEEDITAGGAGQQHAGFTFSSSGPWFVVCATFRAG